MTGTAGLILRLAGVSAVVGALFFLVIPVQINDPFSRADDYPVLLRLPEHYYSKTLSEGRWLNWLWALRPWPVEPQTLLALYLSGWVLFCSAVAVALFRDSKWPVLPALTASALAFMPQGAIISLWFGTLVPLNAILAVFGLIVLFGSPRWVERGLAVGVPLAFMTHSTAPLLMLIVAATAGRPRPAGGSPLRLVLIFGVALGAGMLAAWTLNYVYHGHFGLQIANWRKPNEIEALSDIATNARLAVEQLILGLDAMTLGITGLQLLTLFYVGLSLLWLEPSGRMALRGLLFSVFASCALAFLHMLQSGIEWPLRSMGFLWLACVLPLAISAAATIRRVRRLGLGVGLCLVAAMGGYVWQAMVDRQPATIQMSTLALGTTIHEVSGTPTPTALLFGDIRALPGSAFLFFDWGLYLRMRSLGGIELVICDPFRPRP
ncbi:MAG: hypothetical protein AAFU49_23500, partial [Pseudomonadota bacterium]